MRKKTRLRLVAFDSLHQTSLIFDLKIKDRMESDVEKDWD